MSTYLLAQSVLLLLFALLFMAIHRTLLAREGYGPWLDSRGGPSSQWIFVFPLAAIAYALPAGALFATVRRPIGALLPCAVGLAVYLLLKNVIYALLQRKRTQAEWDGAAFVLMIGFAGLWIFGASVVPLPGWAAWFGVDQLLIAAVAVVSFRVFRLAPTASPGAAGRDRGSTAKEAPITKATKVAGPEVASGEIESIEVHDLVPSGNEVAHKRVFGVI